MLARIGVLIFWLIHFLPFRVIVAIEEKQLHSSGVLRVDAEVSAIR